MISKILKIPGLQPQISNVFPLSLEHFFLSVGQNNFGNKIPFIFDFSNGKEIQPPVMLTNVSFDNLDRDRLLVEDKDANVIDSPVTTTTIASTTSSSGDLSTTGL